MDNTIDKCPFHIGEMIVDYLKSNNISVESAAKMAEIDIEEFQNILNEQSIDTETISNISIALSHNFMTDIASYIDEELNNC